MPRNSIESVLWGRYKNAPKYAKAIILKDINSRKNYASKYKVTFDDADTVIRNDTTLMKEVVIKLDKNNFKTEASRLRNLIEKDIAEYEAMEEVYE